VLRLNGKIVRHGEQMCGDKIVRVLDQFILSDCNYKIGNAVCADQSERDPTQTFN